MTQKRYTDRLREIAGGEENPMLPLVHRDVLLRSANYIESLEAALRNDSPTNQVLNEGYLYQENR